MAGGQRGQGRGGDTAARRAAAGPPADLDPVSLGREICLRALTAAPRSRGELALAMRRKGVAEDAVVEVLDRLERAGLVDDRAFAEAWVSSRQAGRGLARRALAAELRRKGIDDDVARSALTGVDDEDELAAAAGLVRRRLASTANLPTPARVRRLSAMLARKGYPPGVAAAVVRDTLGAEAAELLEAGESRSL